MKIDEIECEYGSNQCFRLWNPKMYDSNNKEIEIPSCDACKCLMTMVIGSRHCGWHCHECNLTKIIEENKDESKK